MHRQTLSKIERQARFVSNMRELGDKHLFPALVIITCTLVPCTIIMPVIVKYL